MRPERIKVLRKAKPGKGPVVYWISRDQRADDNWALLYAQELAIENKSPLIVIFCLVPEFLDATLRQYSFMLGGLKQLQDKLEAKNIEFHLLFGNLEKEIPKYISDNKASIIITDFDPLKIKKKWRDAVLKNTNIPFYMVDTHNIVPCWYASDKQEYAARTFRLKIHRLLDEFLEDFPELKKHPYTREHKPQKWTVEEAINKLTCDKNVPPLDWIEPGEENAHKMLKDFIENRLNKYAEKRNDPSVDYQSNLSPYLHFGQISAQRVALEVSKSRKNKDSKDAFLEELIVRKELSDNFCYYNPDYDNTNCFPDWAKKSLAEHKDDIKPHIYSLEELETANTHDELWNASQRQMVNRGKMYGYMRMYWAKKILEWTPTPDEAMRIAIYLNDKYEIDGRAPNGYTGIAWSIGGIHDRAWPSRPIFGKIRYMSYNSQKTKFDTDEYIRSN